MQVPRILGSAAIALAISGCASALVGNDVLADRAAFALGLSKADITVANRSDDGASTRYQVRTRSGQEYNCTVGLGLSVLGRQVTDALCHRAGEPPRNPLQR